MRRAAILLLVCGCYSASELAGGPPHGCYALEVGEWSRPWPAHWSPPRIIRFDPGSSALFGESGPSAFVLRPDAALPSGRAGRAAPGSAWRPWAGDSIRLDWIGDYAGLEARLERRGPELRGWIRGRTDVVGADSLWPRASVTARRVRCPATL
jgi:hypothetical protein